MSSSSYTCPRCRLSTPIDGAMRFCPRCGLAVGDNDDQHPMHLVIGRERVVIHNRLAFGEICNRYRCTARSEGRNGVFKVARTHLSNQHVAHESRILNRLLDADSDGRLAPFLPRPQGSVNYRSEPGDPERCATLPVCYDGSDFNSGALIRGTRVLPVALLQEHGRDAHATSVVKSLLNGDLALSQSARLGGLLSESQPVYSGMNTADPDAFVDDLRQRCGVPVLHRSLGPTFVDKK